MIINVKPHTNGVRHKSFIKYNIKNKYNYNWIKYISNSGRNNKGKITIHHKGGGVKIFYRIIDFKRNNFDIIGRIIRIEYDPNRNVNIALIEYNNFLKNYILLPKNINIFESLMSSCSKIAFKIGNNMPIGFIPIGMKIHCIQNKPENIAIYIRSAGCYAIILSKNNNLINVVLKSGEIKVFNFFCRATIGELSNEEYFLKKLGKSGINRLKNIRPTVRGVAMNPIDHPHGGGEGKSSGGRDPVSPWGISTKGYKTKKHIKIFKFKN